MTRRFPLPSRLGTLAASLSASVALATLSPTLLPSPARAQSYPIDCAILLCLAGGWPASVPCARARAEFIRRITPWPVEPPLQIWNCPMNTAFQTDPDGALLPRIFKLAYDPEQVRGVTRAGTFSSVLPEALSGTQSAGAQPDLRQSSPPPAPPANIQQAQATSQPQADIDISGSAFDFVRSIKVWHILAYQYSGRQCQMVVDSARLGTYSQQGAFTWANSSTFQSPPWMRPAWLQRSPANCRSVYYRAIGVEWRDYFGKSGHELIVY